MRCMREFEGGLPHRTVVHHQIRNLGDALVQHTRRPLVINTVSHPGMVEAASFVGRQHSGICQWNI